MGCGGFPHAAPATTQKAENCPRLGVGSRPELRSFDSGPSQTAPKQGASKAGVVADTGRIWRCSS
jgi:hypothetical protein